MSLHILLRGLWANGVLKGLARSFHTVCEWGHETRCGIQLSFTSEPFDLSCLYAGSLGPHQGARGLELMGRCPQRLCVAGVDGGANLTDQSPRIGEIERENLLCRARAACTLHRQQICEDGLIDDGNI